MQANAEKEKEIGARILPVDYTSIDALAKAFEANKVETVISTLGWPAGGELEFNLIAAADKSATTKRYIPSVWGMKASNEYVSFPGNEKQT